MDHSNLLEEARRAQEALAYAGRARHIMDDLLGERELLSKQVASIDEAIGSLKASLEGVTVGVPTRALAKAAMSSPNKRSFVVPPKTAASKPAKSFKVAAKGTIRERIIALCAQKPMQFPELRRHFPSAPRNSVAPAVTMLVKTGALIRSGTNQKYVYSVPGGVAPTATEITQASKPNPGSIRQRVLDLCLSGEPKQARDLYSHLPGVSQHTIQTALSGLYVAGKLAHAPGGAPGRFSYCAPSAATQKAEPSLEAAKSAQQAADAPRDETQAAQVLAVCASPETFDGIAKHLPHINRHVLHQTVHQLYASGKLHRSGKRNSYSYVTP